MKRLQKDPNLVLTKRLLGIGLVRYVEKMTTGTNSTFFQTTASTPTGLPPSTMFGSNRGWRFDYENECSRYWPCDKILIGVLTPT